MASIPSALSPIGNLSGSDKVINLIDQFTGKLDSIQVEERNKKISELKNKVFIGLGENWWMQNIDGGRHREGPWAFDDDEEPGYLNGIGKGCGFTYSHLEEPLSVKLYKGIHQSCLCQSVIEKISAKNVGKFVPAGRSTTPASWLFGVDLRTEEAIHRDDEEFKNYQKIYGARKCALDPHRIHEVRHLFPGSNDDEIRSKIANAKIWLEKRQEKLEARRELINNQIEQRSLALGLRKPLCELRFYEYENGFPKRLMIQYGFYDEVSKDESLDVQRLVEKIFIEYEQNVTNAKTPEEKLAHIADLYQVLNWLHPFTDGQGRATLLLLAKELCRHGFNPPILNSPHLANYALLSEWISYLKEGIIEWQKEFVDPHRFSHQQESSEKTQPKPDEGKKDEFEPKKAAAVPPSNASSQAAVSKTKLESKNETMIDWFSSCNDECNKIIEQANQLHERTILHKELHQSWEDLRGLCSQFKKKEREFRNMTDFGEKRDLYLNSFLDYFKIIATFEELNKSTFDKIQSSNKKSCCIIL